MSTSSQADARWRCIGGLIVVLPLGLATKFYPGSGAFYEWARDFGGDALYQVALMLVALLVQPRWPVRLVAWVSFAYSCVIEISQIFTAPWLAQIRATIFGRLILGSTFSWTDFAYFALGSSVGYVVLRRLLLAQDSRPADDAAKATNNARTDTRR